jgi:hypothetical protein
MSTMVRKQVYIEPRQDRLLKEWTAETGMTEAEVFRQAIDAWLAEAERMRRAKAAWQEERAFIESLIAQGPAPGGRRWTREALYEERLSGYGRRSD